MRRFASFEYPLTGSQDNSGENPLETFTAQLLAAFNKSGITRLLSPFFRLLSGMASLISRNQTPAGVCSTSPK